MEITVPQVGESIIEAEIGQWFKKDGELVEKDDLLLELETEKVNVEINADGAGRLEILAKEGETVKVGAVIARIDETATGTTENKPPSTEAKPPKEKPEAAAQQEEADQQSAAEPAATPSASGDLPPLNPAVAKLAAERGIDLSKIKGSGRNGRILVDDLPAKGTEQESTETAEATPAAEPPKSAEPSPPQTPPTKPAAADDERTERVAMTQIRKKIAERLLQARQQTAMLTTFNEIDMSRLIALRNSHKEAFAKKHGVSLGFMSFFVKACAEALKDFDEVNARIDGDDIVYHKYYDIGIAVGSKRGLVVPVIRDADQLHFDDIEKAIRDFAERADSGKLTLDELTGGTFTISNGGIYGSVLSTPLLNPPQSAILGMHAIQDRAVVRAGEIVIRPIMNVALSYDHRIIDGKEAVNFLKQIKTYIEDPEEMLLEL